MRRQRPQRRLLRANKRGRTTHWTLVHVIARPSEARSWQSQSREIETCKSKTEVISKLLEFNGITTSCALHTPRNDRETSSRTSSGILLLPPLPCPLSPLPSPVGRGHKRHDNSHVTLNFAKRTNEARVV